VTSRTPKTPSSKQPGSPVSRGGRRFLISIQLLSAAFAACICGPLHAQLDLEGSVPPNWTATAGTLSISPLHYKAGTESLRWNCTNGSVITIANPGITAADVTDYYKNTCDFWVWNGTAVPGGKILAEFMNGSTAQYWFEFYLDYTGWRRAVRSYTNDMSKKSSPSATFTSVRITVQATGTGSLFLDDVTWAGDRFSRIRDAQNPAIQGTSATTIHSICYAPALDPVTPPTPTPTELAELATIRSRWLSSIKGTATPSASSVTSAGTSFTAMNIVQDADGIRGQPLGHRNPDLESWPLTLARDYAWGTSATNAASRDKVLQLARHLMDQGHAANSNVVPTAPPGPDGYDYRGLPNALVLLAPAYDAATKAKMWEFFRWAYLLGDFWTDTWERNTDEAYLQSIQELGAILFLTPSDAEAVRQLKGYQRYMNRFWRFSEGSEDGLKIDGIGFHHRSHYNRYMYAYKPPTTTFYYLRGTGFQIDQATYENLRLANLTQMRMSADASGTAVGYHGNSHVGRSPFQTDLQSVDQSSLQLLGEVGGAFYGQAADPVIARAYNRRFGVGSYALFTPYGAEDPPDGFLQYNYSPLGIYRRANWVASIRAPQRYFWSSEIYWNSNRYGRYQAYGALEILYHGGRTLTGQQIAGWDWNHTAGSTTIVLPDSKLVAENDREDVRSQLNFVGALAFQDGQSGLYAGNFQESNAGPNHNPTFVWRKSWFAFGSEIICLGSDIANNDTTNPTATTLLQGALATPSTSLTLNGTALTGFPQASTVSGATANWLLDPFSTGYLVKPGDSIKITRSTQTSAHNDGISAPTTGNFAKAWIDHGTAPSGARYEYAVFPGTDATAMAAAASAHANPSTQPYQVIQHDSTAHVVKWKATGQTGYALYSSTALPAATQNAGLLMSVQRPCLVMTQLGTSDDAWISLVDPDLNFSSSQADYGVPDASRARTLDFTINGAWTLDNPDAGTSIVSSNGTTTTLRVTTQHGLAEHVHLIEIPGVWANVGTSWNAAVNWGGSPPTNDLVTDIAVLGAATVQPVLDGPYAVKGVTMAGGTNLSGSGNLTLGASGIVITGSNNIFSLSNLTLASSQSWNVGNGDLTVSSAISGAARLTKTGAGTLTLTGTNTYSGGLSLAGGPLVLLGDQSAATGSIDQRAAGTSLSIGSATQSSPTSVVVGSGGSIMIGETAASGTTSRVFQMMGSPDSITTVTNHGSLSVGRGSLATVGQNSSWQQNGTMTVLGVGGYSASLEVTNGASFAYNGPTEIQINPADNNSGNALLAVTGGATFTTSRGFVFGSGGTGTGTGQLTLSGEAALRLSADIPELFAGASTGTVQLGTGGGIIDTQGFSTTISRDLTELSGMIGSLRKQGNGTLALTGTNTWSGVTTINGGVLSTGLLTSGGTPSGIGAASGSASNLVINGGTLKYTGGALTWSRGFTIGTAGAGFDLSSATGQLWISGSTIAFTGSGPRSLTVTTGTAGGRISSNLGNESGGATSLVKNGSGTLILSATGNTYTGPLQVQAGTVQFGNAASGGESNGFGHSVAISGSAELKFRHASADTVTFNAPISGDGKVNFNYNNSAAGSGSLSLGGNNSFTGGLTISPSSGTTVLPLKAGSTTALGSGTVSIGQYGRLDLNGLSNSTGLLTSTHNAASVTNDGASDATLTLNGSGTQTFGGVIRDGVRKLAIAKSGSGSQSLTAANTYSGDTTVSAGTLTLGQVNFSNETSTVSIASGALLNLAFSGIDTVDRLFINGIQQASGDYNSAHASGRFTGGGTLRVSSGPSPGLASWIDDFGLALADQDPSDDPDNDDMDNLLEFALNGNPSISDTSILPKLTVTASHFEFTYQRRDDSLAPETIQVFQYGSDLTGWTDIIIPTASGSVGVGAGTVTVGAGTPSDAVTDTVTVSIPKEEAGDGRMLFGRLRVTK
jgi:chondroitin-sulfate-ABC endolyase/exolyase